MISFGDGTEMVTDANGNIAVNIYAGGTVTFTSCACSSTTGQLSITAGVTPTNGNALTFNKKSINFKLTDGTLESSDSTV